MDITRWKNSCTPKPSIWVDIIHIDTEVIWFRYEGSWMFYRPQCIKNKNILIPLPIPYRCHKNVKFSLYVSERYQNELTLVQHWKWPITSIGDNLMRTRTWWSRLWPSNVRIPLGCRCWGNVPRLPRHIRIMGRHSRHHHTEPAQMDCKSNAAPISSNPGIWSLPYGSTSGMLVFSVSAKARDRAPFPGLGLWRLFPASEPRIWGLTKNSPWIEFYGIPSRFQNKNPLKLHDYVPCLIMCLTHVCPTKTWMSLHM